MGTSDLEAISQKHRKGSRLLVVSGVGRSGGAEPLPCRL